MENRRDFLKLAGAGALSAASYRRILGANDQVRAGFIGIGLIGKRHLLDFMAQPDVDIAAICETYDPRLEEGVATAKEGGKGSPARFKDFRRMYESKEIDAVVVSTPDHWHALHTILACAAGKDVYVEKPLTHVVREGQWMLAARDHYRRVVQVGTQQRSGEQYRKALELVRGGHIGEVHSARMSAFRNISPGFTQPVGTESLSEQDWQMWLGPAPAAPFDRTRCIYHFRWFWDYSGGQTTNLLAHEIDIVQWVMNAAPRSVAAMGGRYSLKGIGETPDTFEALFEYPGFVAHWSNREASAVEGKGLEFQGTKGTLRVNRAGLEVIPDRQLSPDDQIPRFTAPRPVQKEVQYRTQALKQDGYEQVKDQFRPHVRNFIESIRSRRQPVSDLEGAHQTAVSCHLANISMKLGRSLRWDAQRQEVIGDAEANRMLTKEYRAPWDRELKAALPTG